MTKAHGQGMINKKKREIIHFHIEHDECGFMHTQFQREQVILSSLLIIIFRVYVKGQD